MEMEWKRGEGECCDESGETCGAWKSREAWALEA
jgi:hypothetical protein